MSFLSCCKCEGSRVRRGLLDSASKKKKTITARIDLPHCRPLLCRSILKSQSCRVGAKGKFSSANR